MAKDYKALRKRVEERLNPENILFQKSLREDLSTISYSDILMYVRIAMNAVPPEYTAKSKEAGEMVKRHLDKVLDYKVFRYQGSVMTDTHIKGASDIDLLVISNKSYRIDIWSISDILSNSSLRSQYYSSQISKLENENNVERYSGNTLDDLRELRLKSEETLHNIYQDCDSSKPKAIRIKNLHLYREVDTVIACWYDNVRSVLNDKGDYRGVKIYNKASHNVGDASYPFLSIARINKRSSDTNGRLKKMIRFLKNVREDSNYEIDLNSFEINAICYDIDKSEYLNKSFYELVEVIYVQLKSICTNSFHADRIISVDGTEKIFLAKPEKIEHLKLLLSEVESIYIDLNGLRRAI